MVAVSVFGVVCFAEAERFAARAKAARDNAILDSRAAAIAVGPGGYDVSRRSEAAHYDWVAGTEPALSGGREGQVRFSATGLADPAEIVLRRGGRQVAVDHLTLTGEFPIARRRHAEHYLALVEAAEPSLTGPAASRTLDMLERDYDNIRAVFHWALEGDT